MKQRIFLKDYPLWMSEKQRNFTAWAIIIIVLTMPFTYTAIIGKQKPTVQLFDIIDCHISNEYKDYIIKRNEERCKEDITNINTDMANINTNLTICKSENQALKGRILPSCEYKSVPYTHCINRTCETGDRPICELRWR